MIAVMRERLIGVTHEALYRTISRLKAKAALIEGIEGVRRRPG